METSPLSPWVEWGGGGDGSPSLVCDIDYIDWFSSCHCHYFGDLGNNSGPKDLNLIQPNIVQHLVVVVVVVVILIIVKVVVLVVLVVVVVVVVVVIVVVAVVAVVVIIVIVEG